MSPLPIAAPAFNFPGMQQRQRPPWVVIQQLRQDYDVREVAMSSEAIDADVNASRDGSENDRDGAPAAHQDDLLRAGRRGEPGVLRPFRAFVPRRAARTS